jgi:hypothetical protein
MKTFKLTYSNGRVITLSAMDFSSAIAYGNDQMLVACELIEKKNQVAAMKKANDLLHTYCKPYFASFNNAVAGIIQILDECGFQSSELRAHFIKSDDGAVRCVQIVPDVYLCVTWYKLESGNYEFVAYVS